MTNTEIYITVQPCSEFGGHYLQGNLRVILIGVTHITRTDFTYYIS